MGLKSVPLMGILLTEAAPMHSLRCCQAPLMTATLSGGPSMHSVSGNRPSATVLTVMAALCVAASDSLPAHAASN